LLYVLQRRRAMHQLFRTRNELQRAHDQLERLVDKRTGELRTTNDELKRQIAHRLQVEDELMQAGKLAVLGQMSAGISHEINQPLTALRALSRNTLRLLADGRTAAASDNLHAIDAMVERMGRIVSQLKSFARKGGGLADAVQLSVAIDEALLLLEHRVRIKRVTVNVSVPEQIRVRADITRLGQVLVNLIGNALDAMTHAPLRELRIGAEDCDGRVTVTIIDTGHGMDAAAIERLPEPFFTTKPPGQGLGLGLVISSKIVREFGGSLRASRAEVGMRFEFDLESIENMHV
jgi:two-component system C4-dicarboxylate transport sensor histidine kinase DctB